MLRAGNYVVPQAPPLMEIKMGNPILKYFKYDHLPKHLQEISKPFSELANLMDVNLPNGGEKDAGLRKLLEAKDCFVRAQLP